METAVVVVLVGGFVWWIGGKLHDFGQRHPDPHEPKVTVIYLALVGPALTNALLAAILAVLIMG